MKWDGRLGLIAGVTPVIDDHRIVNALLGERFVYYRLPVFDQREMARKARQARGHEQEMRDALVEAVSAYVGSLDFTATQTLGQGAADRLDALALFTTRARSGVDRDRYSREITALPEPESPTRFVKQIESLALAFKVMGYTEAQAVAYIIKVAQSSIPSIRLRALTLLREAVDEVDTPTVGDEMGLSTDAARRVLEDLAALGMATREAGSGGRDGSHRWWLAEQAREWWSEAEGGAA